MNVNHEDFGRTSAGAKLEGVTCGGTKVEGVRLPPWARGDATYFVRCHREALESEHVSMALHRWVDLVFGVAAVPGEARPHNPSPPLVRHPPSRRFPPCARACRARAPMHCGVGGLPRRVRAQGRAPHALP